MSHAQVPLVVLAREQDEAELINRLLRASGHPTSCNLVSSLDDLAAALERTEPEALIFFPKGLDVSVREIARVRQGIIPMLPLIVVTDEVSEAEISSAMRDGARDLVSVGAKGRLAGVIERELRAFRLERALEETLQSATRYRKQLRAVMASTTDAMAYVKEGIVVEASPAWAGAFGRGSPEAALGPVMDLFDVSSQAAVKGAIVAAERGQWSGDALRVAARDVDGQAIPLKLAIEKAELDGDAAVRLSIDRPATMNGAPETLVRDALHQDPVTGFCHRYYFVERLARRLEHRPRNGVRTLAYIRPDNFKEIKNAVGTLTSEEILAQLAEVLRTLVLEHDLCGRFEGTVFVVLLERGTLRDIEAWAENAVAAIGDRIFEAGGKTLSMTCTIGLAEAGPSAADAEALLSSAAAARERGHQGGGNCVVLEQTSDENTRVQRSDEIRVKQIRAALRENRLSLTHLPIMSLLGERRVLYDTFIRMMDESGEEVPASEFMPAAARNGLLKNIDRWVIAATVAFCRAERPDRVFVKLSRESVLDQTLPDWLTAQIKAAGVDGKQVCFQVTEEDATLHLNQTRALSKQLGSRGFCFAIEHYGIGRDSKRVLEHTPMQYLKIDGSLMQSLASNQGLQQRVRGYIDAAKARKIETIAERVEDANTMAVLFQIGASFVQGHYVHEPEVVLEEPGTAGPLKLVARH